VRITALEGEIEGSMKASIAGKRAKVVSKDQNQDAVRPDYGQNPMERLAFR